MADDAVNWQETAVTTAHEKWNEEFISSIRPWHKLLKPAPDIGAIGLNLTPDSGASLSHRRMTSNVIDCLWGLKAVNDVNKSCIDMKNWCRNLASTLWSQFLEPVSGACVRGLRFTWWLHAVLFVQIYTHVMPLASTSASFTVDCCTLY